MNENYTLLDCTLRDGGYYTHWDFDETLVQEYLNSMETLPVDVLEIGYRSLPEKSYRGAYFYLPEYLLEKLADQTSKKLAVIINEKAVKPADISSLLASCRSSVDIVRVAVAPQNLERSIPVLEKLRAMDFEVSLNLMYASSWNENTLPSSVVEELKRLIHCFYVVDSYGGMLPKEVKTTVENCRAALGIKIGFHGHNNLELALANTLAAMEGGAEQLDSTIGGMGRGAGNLKTELLLTVLHQQRGLKVDFDALHQITSRFEQLQKAYQWGTNVPYMVSGAFSLPQETVFSRIKKRYYSVNSIVNEVTGRTVPNSSNFPLFKTSRSSDQVLLIGGGESVKQHIEPIRLFLDAHPEMPVIHSSSKNVNALGDIANLQVHCLPGMEGKRLKNSRPNSASENRMFVFPPESISDGENYPPDFQDKAYRLKELFSSDHEEISSTAMGLEISKCFGASTVLLIGYDGYSEPTRREEIELFQENKELFYIWGRSGVQIFSLTPTKYPVDSKSVYTLL